MKQVNEGGSTEHASIRPTIVVVDDQETVARSLAAMLEDNGFDAQWTTNGIDVVHYVSGDDGDVDGVVSDYVMRQPDGLELLRTIRQLRPRLPFILYTGRGSETIASKAIKEGATDYIQKGGRETHDILVNSLRNAIRQVNVREELEEEQGRFEVLAETLDAAIFTVDSAQCISYASDDFGRRLGYDPEAILGSPVAEYVADADGTSFIDRLTAHFEEDDERLDTEELTCTLRCSDGSEITTELRLGAHETHTESFVTVLVD